MATQRQLRGGTAAQHEVFTGAEREVTVETDTGRLRTHDGSTAGGYPLALQSEAAGVVAVNFTTDADQALTAAQARNRTIIITDTTPVLTTGRSLTGFVEGATNIVNQTSVVLECFGPTANNGVSVPAGAQRQVYCDGTDVVEITPLSKLSDLTVQPNSSGNVARFVMSTATGSVGTEDGANTWAKLATFSIGENTYDNITGIWNIVCTEIAKAPIARIGVAIRQSTAGLSQDSVVQIFSTIGDGIAKDSFRLIGGNTNGSPVELWVKKTFSYMKLYVVEESLSSDNAEFSVSYNHAAGWQSAEPTGTIVINSDWAGTSWAVPTMLNSWVKQAGLGYKRLANGLVIVDMRVNGGADDTNAFKFPSGFRPSTNVIFRVQLGSTVSENDATIYINEYGDVTVSNGGASSSWVSMYVSFMAEQ